MVDDLRVRPPQTPFAERVALLSVRYMEAVSTMWFRMSGGKVGGSIYGAPVVLLTASGRVTGRRRAKPLLALADGEAWIVVGSRGGTSGHPEWYLNLLAYEADPSAAHLAQPELETADGSSVPVRARVLEGRDRDRWWAELVAVYPRFAFYQERADSRVIPVVRLTPSH